MKVVFNDLVVIAHVGDQFYAFGNVCPHVGGPVGEGLLDDCIVECPWHAGQWDVRTGRALTILATKDLPVFDVRITGDDIEVSLDERVLTQGSLALSRDSTL